MSDPPTTSSEPAHHHQQLLHLPLIHGRSATRINATSSSTVVVREYRKGNWTLQETMILITAKKLDDERRSKANLAPVVDPAARKGGELRWKWVENYCWSHGCHRSQNQCNDKWDNLLRDYKKVRDYESKASSSDGLSTFPSYWKMEKHQRKDKNLPSNMAFELYDALNDVVQRKYSQRATTSAPVPPSAPMPSLPPLLPAPEAATTTFPAVSESSSGTQSSEKENMESKRRKVGGDIASSIERSASVLAETLRSCEERREIRHQQLLELQRRRLQIEESRNQLQQQGMAELIATLAGMNQRSEAYGCLYSGEEISLLKEQNEAMQAELITIKSELSQLREEMPNLLQNMMHNIHNIHPPTSHSQPPHSMDPSGSGGDA